MIRHTPGAIDWTEERVAELKRLYEDGRTATQIAKLFGLAKRGSICGKIHRLGLRRHASLDEHNKRTATVASNRNRALKRRGHNVDGILAASGPRPVPKPKKKAPPAPKPEPSVLFKVGEYGALPMMDTVMPIDAAPVSHLLREPCQCAWPIGPTDEPETSDSLVCGAPVEEGRPYCPTHILRAQRPGGKPFRATDKFLDQLDKALMRANALKMRSAA